ncbi:hypothetical protein L596_022854 [Steinernema carpocapsae]|uniref:Uncharacterized protein n=1 Tax=Steinernema carpocapsae TaxID=34508 RepID=A0A4U5MBP8_STECR|nr:hypothetical protein L596_022854 [Steinernema carpocapsae]
MHPEFPREAHDSPSVRKKAVTLKPLFTDNKDDHDRPIKLTQKRAFLHFVTVCSLTPIWLFSGTYSLYVCENKCLAGVASTAINRSEDHCIIFTATSFWRQARSRTVRKAEDHEAQEPRAEVKQKIERNSERNIAKLAREHKAGYATMYRLPSKHGQGRANLTTEFGRVECRNQKN